VEVAAEVILLAVVHTVSVILLTMRKTRHVFLDTPVALPVSSLATVMTSVPPEADLNSIAIGATSEHTIVQFLPEEVAPPRSTVMSPPPAAPPGTMLVLPVAPLLAMPVVVAVALATTVRSLALLLAAPTRSPRMSPPPAALLNASPLLALALPHAVIVVVYFFASALAAPVELVALLLATSLAHPLVVSDNSLLLAAPLLAALVGTLALPHAMIVVVYFFAMALAALLDLAALPLALLHAHPSSHHSDHGHLAAPPLAPLVGTLALLEAVVVVIMILTMSFATPQDLVALPLALLSLLVGRPFVALLVTPVLLALAPLDAVIVIVIVLTSPLAAPVDLVALVLATLRRDASHHPHISSPSVAPSLAMSVLRLALAHAVIVFIFIGTLPLAAPVDLATLLLAASSADSLDDLDRSSPPPAAPLLAALVGTLALPHAMIVVVYFFAMALAALLDLAALP